MSSSSKQNLLRHAIFLVLIASSVAQSFEKTAYSRPIISLGSNLPDVLEVIEGGNVSVQCVVEGGHPKPVVTMTVTGNIKRRVRYDRDMLKMEINNLSRRENGRIVCEARNGLENFTVQKSVYISVQYLREPNLIVFPPRAAVSQGQWAGANFQINTIFVCAVDSKPSATFTWRRNGVQMVSCQKRGVKITEAMSAMSVNYSPPPKPISTMTLSADLPESNKTGYYECIATSRLNGSAISKQYGLNYTSATAIPVVELKTKNKQYVNTGGIIRIICEAFAGQPLPQFIWTLQQKSKAVKTIRAGGKISIMTQSLAIGSKNVSSKLTITDVGIEHDGTYSCVANNHVDMQFKRKTRVVVRYLKSVKFWLTSFDFAEDKKNGKAVWITCYAETSPETVVKYTWYKKAGASDEFVQIPTSGNKNREIKFLKKKDERNSVVLPARSSRLEIKHLQETDCGFYRCHAQVVGLESKYKESMDIEVNDNLEPPHFLPIDKRLVVRENENVTLRCNVTGRPQSKVMFYRQHNATMPELYKGEKALWRLVNTNGTLAALTITNVKRKHRGTYFCRSFRVNGFTNKPRTQWKGEISLDVQYPPELKPVYQEIRIATNKERKLRCNVYGTYPKISSVTWYKNGQKQAQRTRYYKLDVRNDTSDYGTYVCRVANPAGNRTCTFNVSGKAFPPEFFYNNTALRSGYDDDMLTVRGTSAEYFNGPTAQYDYHLFWTQKNPNAVDSVEKYEIKWRALDDESRKTRQTSDEGSDDSTPTQDWEKDTLTVGGRTDYPRVGGVGQQQSGHLFSLTLKNLSRLNHALQKYEVVITPINKLGEGDSSRRVVRLQRSPRNVKWDSEENFFCQFSEPDICGFMQDLSLGKEDKLFNWTRNSNITLNGRRTSNTGPEADRSNHKIDGGYMYVESSFMLKDYRARLISPVFKSSMKCLKFFYHMKGKSIGRLSVKQRWFGINEEVEVWSKKGEISSTWNVDNISFFNKNRSFSIVFEATMTEQQNNWGDIAIDDILVDRKECIDIPTSTPPTTSSSTTGLVSHGRRLMFILLPLFTCVALN